MNEAENRISVQFIDADGNKCGDCLRVPVDSNIQTLNKLLNVSMDKEEIGNYAFFITDNVTDEKSQYTNGEAIVTTIKETIEKCDLLKEAYFADIEDDTVKIENTLRVVFTPQSLFKVRAINRCTASLPGHKAPVICSKFSNDGRYLASGSGDKMVKFWDLNTQTPAKSQVKAHRSCVRLLAWSPDGNLLASGAYDADIQIWKLMDKAWSPFGNVLRKKIPAKNVLKSICWQPLHLEGRSRFLAASYLDTTVVIWDTVTHLPKRIISGHSQPVLCVVWSGTNHLICGVKDGSIKIWEAETGHLFRDIKNHMNWVNFISLSTTFSLRCGAYEPKKPSTLKMTPEELQQKALEIYERSKNNVPVRMVVACEDKTLSLWQPFVEADTDIVISKRMLGHQREIVEARFSPDGMLIASASFDKSVRLWDGLTGRFLHHLYGHMNMVSSLEWSPDSRFLVSGGFDSQVIQWTMSQVRGLLVPLEKQPGGLKSRPNGGNVTAPNCKRVRISHVQSILPGHRDTVWDVDWSPDGSTVVSAGKDSLVRLWRA